MHAQVLPFGFIRLQSTTRPIFFQPSSCIRVDLLTDDSKPTEIREQYDWMGEKKLDGYYIPHKKPHWLAYFEMIVFVVEGKKFIKEQIYNEPPPPPISKLQLSLHKDSGQESSGAM